jgi:hypothetical protein
MVRGVSAHESASEQNDVTKFVRRRGHERKRILQQRASDRHNHVSLITSLHRPIIFLVYEETCGYLSALAVPRWKNMTKFFCLVRENSQLNAAAFHLHVCANTAEELLRRCWVFFVRIREVLRSREDDPSIKKPASTQHPLKASEAVIHPASFFFADGQLGPEAKH